MIKRSLSVCFLIFFICIFSKAYAQGLIVPLQDGPGCLFNGKVYQKPLPPLQDGTPLFSGVEGDCISNYSNPTSPPWEEQFGNGSCTVWVDCASTGNSSFKKGKLGTVYLPLDDYVLPFSIILCTFIVFKLKNQSLRI